MDPHYCMVNAVKLVIIIIATVIKKSVFKYLMQKLKEGHEFIEILGSVYQFLIFFFLNVTVKA